MTKTAAGTLGYPSSPLENIIILSFSQYGFGALRAKGIHLFTRFHTGAAITPFCTRVTVIISPVAPSAL